MFSAALLLFSLASICQYVMPYEKPNLDVMVVSPTEKVSNVYLWNTISGKFCCGGNLINSIYILTAAECVVGRQHDEIVVYIGCQRPQQFRCEIGPPIREIIIHEEYDPRDLWRNNIALIRLYFGISFSNSPYYIRPVPIPDNNTIREMADGSVVAAKVFGHGISQSVITFKNEMLKSNTSMFTWDICNPIFKRIYNLSKTQICADDPSRPNKSKIRVSDVGGPLIFRSQVAGIALSAPPEEYFYLYLPQVFTNVASYREWIDLQLEVRQASDRHFTHVNYSYIIT